MTDTEPKLKEYERNGKTIREWRVGRKLHRKDGPAKIILRNKSTSSIDYEWWLNGELHREDGPATYTEYYDFERMSTQYTNKYYYVHGIRLPYIKNLNQLAETVKNFKSTPICKLCNSKLISARYDWLKCSKSNHYYVKAEKFNINNIMIEELKISAHLPQETGLFFLNAENNLANNVCVVTYFPGTIFKKVIKLDYSVEFQSLDKTMKFFKTICNNTILL